MPRQRRDDVMVTIRLDSEDERELWKAHARARGRDLAALVRELMAADMAGQTAGVTPPRDPDYLVALEDLAASNGIIDRAVILRAAVMAAHRRLKADGRPFVDAPSASGVVPFRAPEGTQPPPRGRGGR